MFIVQFPHSTCKEMSPYEVGGAAQVHVVRTSARTVTQGLLIQSSGLPKDYVNVFLFSFIWNYLQ